MDRRERLKLIIRMLQESPRSSLDIKARFPRVSARSIERDIEQLALEGRIQQISQDRSRNPRWQTREQIPAIEVKWMSGRAAAAVKLMQRYMSPLLPSDFLDELQPLFRKADLALRQSHNKEFLSALDEVELPTSAGKDLPMESINHLVTLKEAVKTGQTISLRFDSGESDGERYLEKVSPLGLVIDEKCISLVAAHEAYAAPLKISLREIRQVELQEAPSLLPAGFNLGEPA
ncbi:MAG: hypothetical protein K0Q68_327 [Moraxellaceae bacterium]|jgi:predicted DNA-binding transcriptional regulator YafY|nr:hypothetical protein [Moraxellaceae bacterium]